MQTFKYIVSNTRGEIEEGIQDAQSKDDLIASLHEKSYTVISVTEKEKRHKKASQKHLRFFLKSDDLVLYARQLAVLIGAGIPLLRALTVLMGQIASMPLYKANEQIIVDVQGGVSFRDALAKHPKIFSSLWLNLVETGEASGQMPTIMERLADHLEAENELKAKVISALTYPILLVCAVIGVILFLLLYLIPIFGDVYKDLGVPLPLVTSIVIQASNILKIYAPLFFIGAILGGVGLALYYKTKQGKYWVDSLVLKIPVFNILFRMQIENEFTSGLAILIRSGIPILQAVDIMARTSSNAVACSLLEEARESIRAGRSIAGPLEEGGLYSHIVVQMVAVGEETGELANLLEKAYVFTKSRLDHYVARLAALLEPFIILIIGAVVGVIAFAVYIPIFQLITTMPGG